ncbi:chromosome segregation protein SMC [Pontiella agarivorans]|uniref:Chromosome partition protein Smc n=1 Tax=Pontiella agarivorans TaxID=3038953 RepID=A0ABU5N0U6_9BACT|nr:chromosome segregation protein SMC [Pontiella agarivorans]MDZ8120062.1 chromosome segregation protein SMC [Pontiella agarivorans]
MYLKTLEIVGFKSFANKTKLDFEPGMTAIVGPNGCGKSNVSDAVRWVLGEQRARALRGAKMEDVIFNGTDSSKPLGMAEVSITLADCTEALGIEYDEVCITRRVFRSGESGYFLNRKACRLKDIQRLFMDTGVGTDSYSVLEQGKIDQILSARADDRRTVFEEAAGITKYKADKKEALRKLEHTEANLLRLDDVVREVKRQIISLQRQAGKARRYKELSEEMRSLDLYVTNQRLKEYAQKINELSGELQVLEHKVNELHKQVESAEAEAKNSRSALTRLEESISQAMEQASAARSELERTRNLITMNTDRIAELTTLAQRNTQETEEARVRLESHRAELEQIISNIQEAEVEKEAAGIELEKVTEIQKQAEEKMNATRMALNELRNESVALDSKASKMQNELNALDARDREAMLKKERLATEKAELERSLASFTEREEEMTAMVETLQSKVAEQADTLNSLNSDRASRKDRIVESERKLNELQKTAAAKRARHEMLSGGEARQEGFPPGAQILLNPPDDFTPDHSGIIGPLAEQMTTSPEYQTALEAILRPCIDAVVVRDEAFARETLNWLRDNEAGSARLLSVASAREEAQLDSSAIGRALIDCITFDDAVAPLIRRLFWNVRVVGSEVEIPDVLSADTVVVTQNGTVISGCGASEIWMPGTEDKSPLARHQLREQLQSEINGLEEEILTLENQLETLRSDESTMVESINSARQMLEEFRRELALQEGELQVVSRETKTARNRVETVTFEFNNLQENESEGAEMRRKLATELQNCRNRQSEVRQASAEQTRMLTTVEEERNSALQITSEHRIVYSQKTNILEHLNNRKQPMEARIAELEELINERSSGVDSYNRRIEDLKVSIEDEQNKIQPLEDRLDETTRTLEAERSRREETIQILTTAENRLQVIRRDLENELNKKSTYEVEKAEFTMRHDNALERVTGAYQITKEELAEAEAPHWENDEVPEREVIETRVAELQAKLNSMGPVNLVAIEEHAEHEERYTFLLKQQEDLAAAKQQLLDMIKTINNTTTELFKDTFNKVNTEFQEMFKKLFGGGSAKLVLTDDEDVLEAGIEIIARPPGKKLQTISLLSGGERTMTAVALLFSLFKVKPSPFCVLDELDAALDDANINRFVEALTDFLTQSQFIIITHSRQTIAAASVIYGVTMQTRGISKVVSMKFADYQANEKNMK